MLKTRILNFISLKHKNNYSKNLIIHYFRKINDAAYFITAFYYSYQYKLKCLTIL